MFYLYNLVVFVSVNGANYKQKSAPQKHSFAQCIVHCRQEYPLSTPIGNRNMNLQINIVNYVRVTTPCSFHPTWNVKFLDLSKYLL